MTQLTTVPTLDSQQFQQMYQLMQEQGVSTLQCLETSGMRVAEFAARLLAGDEAGGSFSSDSTSSLTSNAVPFDQVADRPVVVLTGGGNSGAIGLIAARHLAEHDAWIQVLTLTPPNEHCGLAADALNALLAADVPLAWADDGWELPPCDLLIDAMIGLDQVGVNQIGLGQVEIDRVGVGRIADASDISAIRTLIDLTNSSLAPILSVGSPSGVTSGKGDHIFVQASATLALGYPHLHLQDPATRAASGDLYLADIGIPYLQMQKMALPQTVELASLFSRDTLVRIDV